MIKTVGVVSLSAGTLGEDFVRHELELGVRRLEHYGLKVRFLPHALKGIDYLKAHPEARAADLLEAFRDPEIDLILCAIGGDDTYRLLPYLFDEGRLEKAACRKPFLGFSDSTVNHFMLHKVGLPTFYGQSFLSDVCEMDKEMLPYTRRYFEELLRTGTIRQVEPSEVWYEGRTDYSPACLGTPLPAHPAEGWKLLQGPPVFSGKILGGCLDTIHDFFDGERYADMPALCQKYGLFPGAADWQGRILLLETSEEQMSPEKFSRALGFLKQAGVFKAVSGILFGRPMDNVHREEYHRRLAAAVDDPALPILADVSVGHALPRCILPFGVNARVDAQAQTITFDAP
ncbi:S66 family peptidase [Allofournierella sp.]|uniref:S66 family peptidase n=1 Tax=Allofournierella sp. TaxID=1940256 RepID=UPI002E7A33B3|nr:S66 peptidase family protein [Fournierella sp.]MEE0756734.1 S66 peptidase family protein [Fournierella sp.]